MRVQLLLQVSVAASVADAAVTQAQLRRLLSLPDGEDEEAKPLLVAAPPQAPAAALAAVPAAPSGALLQQLERAKAGQAGRAALSCCLAVQ